MHVQTDTPPCGNNFNYVTTRWNIFDLEWILTEHRTMKRLLLVQEWRGSTVYRGVLISGSWNGGVPLYTEVSSFRRLEGGVPLYTKVSLFQEVGKKSSPVYRGDCWQE